MTYGSHFRLSSRLGVLPDNRCAAGRGAWLHRRLALGGLGSGLRLSRIRKSPDARRELPEHDAARLSDHRSDVLDFFIVTSRRLVKSSKARTHTAFPSRPLFSSFPFVFTRPFRR